MWFDDMRKINKFDLQNLTSNMTAILVDFNKQKKNILDYLWNDERTSKKNVHAK